MPAHPERVRANYRPEDGYVATWIGECSTCGAEVRMRTRRVVEAHVVLRFEIPCPNACGADTPVLLIRRRYGRSN